MKGLRIATVTGASDDTDLGEMKDLSAEFPFVEWGVLLSRSSMGNGKYPATQWLSKFEKLDARKSVHICGAWARIAVVDLGKVVDMARLLAGPTDRVQINVPRNMRYALSLTADKVEPSVIVQTHSFEDFYARPTKRAPLHDLSGGLGRVTDSFDFEHAKGFFGVAGGFSAENVFDRLVPVQDFSLKSGIRYWIDAEGALRTDERLDLSKVRAYLEAVAPLVDPS